MTEGHPQTRWRLLQRPARRQLPVQCCARRWTRQRDMSRASDKRTSDSSDKVAQRTEGIMAPLSAVCMAAAMFPTGIVIIIISLARAPTDCRYRYDCQDDCLDPFGRPIRTRDLPNKRPLADKQSARVL